VYLKNNIFNPPGRRAFDPKVPSELFNKTQNFLSKLICRALEPGSSSGTR